MGKYTRRYNLLLDEKTKKSLEKQSRNAKKTQSQFIRDLINKRAGLKTLREIHIVTRIYDHTSLNLSAIKNNIQQIENKLIKDNRNFNSNLFYENVDSLLTLIQELQIELKQVNKILKSIV